MVTYKVSCKFEKKINICKKKKIHCTENQKTNMVFMVPLGGMSGLVEHVLLFVYFWLGRKTTNHEVFFVCIYNAVGLSSPLSSAFF